MPPPVEAYRWNAVEIIGGGFVTGLICHPAEPGLMYARTDIGGAYRWNPTAKRWIPLTDWVTAEEWTLTGIESIAVDPRDPDRVYIAAGTYTNDWSGPGAFLLSQDRGDTFRRINMPFKMGGNESGRSSGERLAVDPNDGDVIFFGSRKDGLWKSEDAGLTWARQTRFPGGDTTDDGWGCIASCSSRPALRPANAHPSCMPPAPKRPAACSERWTAAKHG